MRSIHMAVPHCQESVARSLQKGRTENVPLEKMQEQQSDEEILGHIVKKEETAWLRKQIHNLPEPYKEVVMLRVAENFCRKRDFD